MSEISKLPAAASATESVNISAGAATALTPPSTNGLWRVSARIDSPSSAVYFTAADADSVAEGESAHVLSSNVPYHWPDLVDDNSNLGLYSKASITGVKVTWRQVVDVR